VDHLLSKEKKRAPTDAIQYKFFLFFDL